MCYARCCNDETTQQAGNVLESHSMCYAPCCNDETSTTKQAMFGESLCAMHAVAMMRQHNKAGNVLESHSMCYARCCNDEIT